ncbi:hypothetical protein BU204_28475 [Actinophytocola xanthii]|uniref:Zinc-finger domain-containing protein n=1 Tax=Actinophytocola xanthii TaxID=1912961 RepID=A0A1Q8CE24_9PSEU|nr:hypothetical protein BU204_28475 [Actinophytocola xanthii]
MDVGAYVLGILDEPDEAAYEKHFAQCEQCRREFIELADMPAALDMLKPGKAAPPAPPPLSDLIDFSKLGPPPTSRRSSPRTASMPSMPAVPPQQRPAGATQPHKVPPRPGAHPPTNGGPRPVPGHAPPAGAGPRANGSARPILPGRPNPATPPPGADGTGRRLPAVPPPGAAPHGRPRPDGTGRHQPATPPGGTPAGGRPDGTGRHKPATPPAGSPVAGRSRVEGTGRHKPATPPAGTPIAGRTRAEGTGQHPAATGTGRHKPATPPAGTPAAGRAGQPPATNRPEGTGRHKPAGTRAGGADVQASSPALTPAARPATKPTAKAPAKASKAPAKPPTKARDSLPAGRAGGRRMAKPMWLSAAAVVAVAMVVGVVISLSGGGEPGDQVAVPSTQATTAPSDAVAGAHTVNGTDPETGITAIITVEPVADGTEVDLLLYEVDGQRQGTLYAVSRFGEHKRVTAWRSPPGGAGAREAVRASGIVDMSQQDIIRFELIDEQEGIAPVLEVPI